jgi:DNA mismatch repair ATPase MutS
MNQQIVNFIQKKTLYHNNEAYHDLAINNDMFKVLDKTVTKIGSKKLRNRLKYCSSNVNYLENIALRNYTIHQDLIYRYDMEKHLTAIKDLESSLDSWMLNICDKSLVFNWSILNNRYLLSLSNKMKFSTMIIVIVVYVLIYLYLNYHGLNISTTDYIKGIVYGYYAFLKIMCLLIMNNHELIEWTALIITSLYVGYQLYTTYQAINASYQHYSLCTEFYKDYQKIAKYIDTVENMCAIETYIDTNNVNESIKYLKYYFTEDVSLGFSLVTKLESDNYVKHIDILANFIGRIDCQLCITKLIDEGFVIPKFVNAKFPILHMEGVWNPIIPYNKRIKNSLVMNVTKPNVLIITGPNKAGKSTFMRSVMTCVYLSQSLGISCCDKMALTPFIDLFTYLNVPDCIGRESLFEAELNRCYTYIEKIESFKGFSMGIVDELFTGTNPKEGKAASYAILKRISNNPINITILSTHFHDVIGYLDPEKFIFGKFTAKKIKEKFTYDYKMHDGVSNQCIALQLLKERGFDKDIIGDAINFAKINSP